MKYKICELISSKFDQILINPWGMIKIDELLAIADNGSNKISFYCENVSQLKENPYVNTQGPPTGIIYNSNKAFVISLLDKSSSSYILIATENGLILGLYR